MKQRILGIEFSDLPLEELVDQALKGGLTVVPSGPGLAVDLRHNEEYQKALATADTVIADSGAMALFWRLFRGRRIRRISGLRFLSSLLQQSALHDPGATFWVHPSECQQLKNRKWLLDQGLPLADEDNYVAPMYPEYRLSDKKLWDQLSQRNPKAIILCIGGGVQERLGWWIREQYRVNKRNCPAIICTGAAIGFLSGNQVHIPAWADRMYLGWLIRCLSEPRRYLPRYWSAVPLAYRIFRYKAEHPNSW